jgi:hypothetical protein
MPGTDQVLTDEKILEFIFQRMDSEQTFTFTKLTTGVYQYLMSKDCMIYGLSFTGEDGVTYTSNASGSIHVTAGTATATSISATGCLVYFNMVIVDILKWMATHRSIEAGVTVPMGSYMPRTSQEILDMASVWEGITNG